MIDVLKVIYSLLMASTPVTDLVGDDIYPVIVPNKDDTGENIDYPLIVMRRTLTPEPVKSCGNCDIATVEVMCFSTRYYESIDLAQAVRDTLDKFRGNVDGIIISDIRLDSVTEDFSENAYYQQLSFEVK